MFHKLAILTLMLVALAGGLLLLRQERLEIANQNAQLLWQIDRTSKEIWADQARSTSLLRPREIQSRIESAKLGLEPYDPAQRTNPRRGWAQNSSTLGSRGAIR